MRISSLPKELKSRFLYLLPLSIVFVPLPAFADLSSLDEWIGDLASIVIVAVTALLAGVVFVQFILNIIKLMAASGNSAAQKDLKGQLVWNILILFVFVGVWGIIALLSSWTGVGVGGSGAIPAVGVEIK